MEEVKNRWTIQPMSKVLVATQFLRILRLIWNLAVYLRLCYLISAEENDIEDYYKPNMTLFLIEVLMLHYFKYICILCTYYFIGYINNKIQFTTKRIFGINTEHIAGVHLSLSSFSRSLTKIFFGSGSKLWLG